MNSALQEALPQHPTQSVERLRHLADRLKSRAWPDAAPAEIAVWSAPGRVSFAEAARARYRPTHEGESFGPRWSTHWFRVRAIVPRAWRGREVALFFQGVCEATVWDARGRILTGLVSSEWGGLKDVRSHCPLLARARGGERIELFVEAAINGLFGFGMNNDVCIAQPAAPKGELLACHLVAADPVARGLWHDVRTLALLASQLPEKHPLRAQALCAGTALADIVRAEEPATHRAGRQAAARFFRANRGGLGFDVLAVGHAHIDTGWLWPVAESVRKCVRSFSAQLRLMERYPEHRFACSQALHLAWMKDRHPALFAEIKRAARAGRFAPCGGAWIEPDCNLPSGESLVRQFLLGQRFYEREFGQRCREFWNPDVFGYSAALPQILRGVGIECFLTQKLSWSQFNAPIHSTFLWEGLDGTRVPTHFPPANTYNGNAEPGEVWCTMDAHRGKGRARAALYLFGWGDGGGGPTEEMLERLRRLRSLDGLPRVKLSAPGPALARVASESATLPVWRGELYLELHRGTYTSQAATKRHNRRAEEALHDTEFLCAVAHAQTGMPYPHAALTCAWEQVCLNQFHDILPGSSIGEVYREADSAYAEIFARLSTLRATATRALFGAPRTARRVAVVNTLGFARREVVETAAGPRLVEAPSLGWSVPSADPAPAQPVTVRRVGAGFVLANGRLRARLDARGRVTSLRELATGRECVARGQRANQFTLFEDKPIAWDAWDIDLHHLGTGRATGEPTTPARLTQSGPLLAEIEFRLRVGVRSSLRLRVRLAAESPRLEFRVDCDWHEDQALLKTLFPLAVRSDHATYETQFGHVRRPNHFNTSWDVARFEVCAHRWADLSEPGFGVALLNDSKYGHSCLGHTLGLSLLRAPREPDPKADRGHHEFSYALLPHIGPPQSAGVIEAAAAFNQPLQLAPSTAPVGARCSFLSVDAPGVTIDTVKLAEDGDALVVRLHESRGNHADTRLRVAWPLRRVRRANLLEDPGSVLRPARDGSVRLAFRPFEIVTLLLERR